MNKRKKIRTTIPNIATFIIVFIAISIFLRTPFFIVDQLIKYCPEFWEFLDKDNLFEGGITAGLIRLITLIVIVAIGCGVGFILYKVSAIIANYLLGCDITKSWRDYPKSYYISKSPYNDQDRLYHVQSTWFSYRHAYTVNIEFTFEEMEKILSYMDLNGEQYCELPKSFLMPDNVSWLHPKVTLRTVRRIMREFTNHNGAVLLEYAYYYPKKSQIVRTPANIRIKANLHCPTYTSKDVFIGPNND